MTPELLTSIRELDSRTSGGILVRLLWCQHTVTDPSQAEREQPG